MYKLTKIVFSTITTLAISNTTFAENVLSKTNTDSIFKMQKHECEKIAPKYVLPFGKIKLKQMAKGIVVATYNNLTGYGLSIQPIYSNSNFGPSSLIIGSFYPTGTMKANFSEIQKDIENDSEKDLGSAYRVSAAFIKVCPNIGEIELTITLKP